MQWQQAWGGAAELVEVGPPLERSGAMVGRLRWEMTGASSGAHIPADWAEFTFVGWFGADGSVKRLMAFFDHDAALAAADAGPGPA